MKPISRIGSVFTLAAGLMILLIVLSGSALGQSGGGAYGSTDPNDPDDPSNNGPQAGQGALRKEDGGLPPPPPPPDDAVNPQPPKKQNRSPRLSEPAAPSQPRGGAGGMSRNRRRGSVDFNRWEVWWERNKYNIFKLKKIYDKPVANYRINPSINNSEDARLQEIERFKHDVVIPALSRLLTHSHYDVRSAAAIAMGKVQAVEKIPELEALIQDRSDVVKASALFALGLMEEARATYILLNLAHDSVYGKKVIGRTSVPRDERGYAALAMALRKARVTSRSLNQFFEQWKDVEPELLALLVEASGIEGKTKTIPSLTGILLDQKIPEAVRSTAATSLGKIGDPCVVPILLECLDLKSLNIRRSAAIALGNLVSQGDTEAIKKMVRVMETENDLPLRNFLAIALGNIGGKRAKDALIMAFPKAASTQKPWIALGLGLSCRITQESSVCRLLIDALESESNPSTRGAYAIALGILNKEDAAPVLAEVAREAKEPNLKGYAALALGMLGLADHAGEIKEIMLTASDPATIRCAALGLGVLGNARSVDDLVELIRTSNNPYIQSYAAIGLGLLGDFEVARTLVDIAGDEKRNPFSVAYAANALGILFDRERIPALSKVAQDSNYLTKVGAIEWILNIGI